MNTPDDAELRFDTGDGEQSETPVGQVFQYVAARYGGRYVAVPLARVRRVLRDVRISLLPAAHPALPGIAAVDGRILAVLDIGPLLGETALPVDVAHWGIWVTNGELEALLLVERVVDLHEVPEEEVVLEPEGVWEGKYPWPLPQPESMVYIINVASVFAMAAKVYG